MKISKALTSGILLVASAVLFAGCAGITHEPKVDMDSLKDIDRSDFYKALESINIDESETDVMENTSFSFAGKSKEYEIECNIDARSDNDNTYSYTKCVDEATAKSLFEYYYDDYDHIFDSKDFSGIKSYEVGDNTAYILIDGRFDDSSSNTYTPYHDAIFLKGDTVIVAIASDYDLSIEKEVNDFLNALGYPHP